MNHVIKDSYSASGDTERWKIKQRSAVPFLSEAMYNSTEKDKREYINNTCRHTITKQDTRQNNYNVHVRIFDHCNPDYMIQWYTKIQDVFLKKPYDDVESKSDFTELLLSGQLKGDFLQVKSEICDAEATTEDLAINTKCEVTEETSKEVLQRFRDYMPSRSL